MSVPPALNSVDLVVTFPLHDLARARASHLPYQHDIMSGWGGPPQSRTCYFTTTGSTKTRTIGYRSPPGVTHVGVEALFSGDGTIQITSSVGILEARSAVVINDGPNVDRATNVWLGEMELEDALVVWTELDHTLQVTLIPGTLTLTLYALVFHPVHVPR